MNERAFRISELAGLSGRPDWWLRRAYDRGQLGVPAGRRLGLSRYVLQSELSAVLLRIAELTGEPAATRA